MEKASDIGYSLKGMVLSALFAVLYRAFEKDKGASDSKAKEDENQWIELARMVLAIVLLVVALVVQLLVLALVLCVVSVLYVLGLYLSAGISLWRLKEHDYGSNAEGGANLKPALNVLYSLAVAQGVLFGYKTIYDYVVKPGLVEDVASDYSMDTALVKDYLDETLTGCMKDTSFTRGKNLVTYAVHLLMEESKSRDGYLSGVRVLGTILRAWSRHLVLEAHIAERSGSTLAMIVASVAGSIRLEEHFPGGTTMIQCVSSLLDTFEEYNWRPEGYERHGDLPKEYERDWLLDREEIRYLGIDRIPRQKKKNKTRSADVNTHESDSSGDPHPLQGYKGLVVQGLRILQRLAANENNCRVIRNTEGLLPKTIVPLTTDQLHSSHDKQSSIAAEESLELMKRLMATPGETQTKLPNEVSGNSQAIISSLETILECHRCEVLLKRQAVEVLLDLSVDIPYVMSGGNSRKIFVWTLLHIFLLPDNFFDRMCGSTHLAKKSSDIRRLAGEKLQQLAALAFMNEVSATSMLQSSVAAVLADLTRTGVDATVNITNRLHVVQILEDLCKWYTKDDEYLKELKNAMVDVMPKVLKEILVGYASTSAEIQAKTEANNDQFSAQRTDDIEEGVVPPGNINGQEDASSSQHQSGDEQHEGIRLQEAFISLCTAINLSWRNEFDDLAKKTFLEQGIPSKPVKGNEFQSLLLYVIKQKKAQRLATEG
ncbi:unnamed protein product [Urochloa decumbens]|uniref:Uncharacterized protein n=1 Tax=Urochloa decumbens TaxID=240449 RepID=A0ABC8VXX6_9POAL